MTITKTAENIIKACNLQPTEELKTSIRRLIKQTQNNKINLNCQYTVKVQKEIYKLLFEEI